MGIIESMANKFKQPSSMVVVKHISETCRSKGDKNCVYEVRW